MSDSRRGSKLGTLIIASLRLAREPATALLAAAILLPVVLFALAAWTSYRDTLREAAARVDRTARVLEEHALKVFETHRLAIQQVNLRLRFVDWSREADRADLYHLLKQMQDDLDQIATVTVSDKDGRMIGSSRLYPVDPKITFSDRDYFIALRQSDPVLPFVSQAYPGRTSGIAIFNLAARIKSNTQHDFAGVISVSVDRGYFERFYQNVEPAFDHSVDLVRSDGQILARVPATPLLQLPKNSLFLQHIGQAPSGNYTAVSWIDGVERIFGYRKIGDYPVYVRFGISTYGAMLPWRNALLTYGIVAALASLALVGVSVLALRQTARERHARHRWEVTAEALRREGFERNRIEAQLRQAQKMEAVGRITGGVAHDFNNLLTAVIGSLDLVRRRPDKIDARNLALIGNALEGANRAASLTSRLLAFSRLQPLQPKRVDANALVEGMSDLLRRTLGETIVIETFLEADLWPVMADSNQLESALLNLAVNARDAMPEGGRLEIRTRRASIKAGAESDLAPGDYVVIEVCDTGGGMTDDVMANIFEPFFTTKPIGKGTGLGLSQVYGFVKQSGGTVTVKSAVGFGASFALHLPRAFAPPSTADVTEDSAGAALDFSAGRRGETIVVVEDEPVVRRLSVAALEEAGFRVLEAADGTRGLELLRAEPEVALLFTDVVLGGAMNGRALADAIWKERPRLPVLFTTGYTRDAIIQDGRVEEGVALIGKPFTSGSLVSKVTNILRERSEAAAPVA